MNLKERQRRRRKGPGFDALVRERLDRRECCCWDCLRSAGLTPPKTGLSKYLPIAGSGSWLRGIEYGRINPFTTRNLEGAIERALERKAREEAAKKRDQGDGPQLHSGLGILREAA